MSEEQEHLSEEHSPPMDYAWAVVLSVLFVMLGLFVGLPWLLTWMSAGPWASLPTVLIIVPWFPTITGWLQGEMTCQRQGCGLIRSLLREYLFHAWNLGLELTLLLISLPVIAARLLCALVGILLVVFAAVLVIAFAQQVLGIQMKGVVVFTLSDIWLYTKLLLAGVVSVLLTAGLATVMERLFDRGASMAGELNQRVMHWLHERV